jgi:hypothetical protein
MTLAAGARATPGLLWRDLAGTALTDITSGSTGVYTQWGTEEATMANPGVAVKVAAQCSGRVLGSTSAGLVTIRVGISLDGGSTWTYGNTPIVNHDSSSNDVRRVAVTAMAYVEGTPTGDIQVRAEIQTSTSSVGFLNGYITAQAVAS